jgi:hypothetical protein
MKQVIAYSLYGSDNRYMIGAIKNALLAQKHFAGYEIRFYTGASVPDWTRSTLALIPNVQLVDCDGPEDHTAKLWRFKALADQAADVVLSRDADARLTRRERLAHEDFLASRLDFHIMKDHPIGHNYKISAGMFAARKGAIPEIAQLIEEQACKDYYTQDQDWLAEQIWPRIKDNCLIHDETYGTQAEGISAVKPFPISKEATLHHIGAALDENDRYIFDIDRHRAKAETGSERYLAEWLA